jgi:hypothetical protein
LQARQPAGLLHARAALGLFARLPRQGPRCEAEWFELGIGCDDSDGLLKHLQALGTRSTAPTPGSSTEHHHLNLTANPGPLLAPVGPTAKPAKTPKLKAVPAKSKGR